MYLNFFVGLPIKGKKKHNLNIRTDRVIGPDLSDTPDIGPDELAAIRLRTSSHINHFGGKGAYSGPNSNLKSLNLAKLSWGGGVTLYQLKSKVPQPGQFFIFGRGSSGPTQIQKSLNLFSFFGGKQIHCTRSYLRSLNLSKFSVFWGRGTLDQLKSKFPQSCNPNGFIL